MPTNIIPVAAKSPGAAHEAIGAAHF